MGTMNCNVIFKNNIYLSLLLGTLLSIIVYCLNKKDEKRNLLYYIKILLASMIIIYATLYFKNGNQSGGSLQSGILEDINLDDPSF